MGRLATNGRSRTAARTRRGRAERGARAGGNLKYIEYSRTWRLVVAVLETAAYAPHKVVGQVAGGGSLPPR